MNLDNCLQFGVTKSGEWVHIDDIKRGRSQLRCPFCDQRLIAKKGEIMMHHFAHDGETCRASSDAINTTQIPLFNTFNTLDRSELEYVERRRKYKTVYGFRGMDGAIQRLETMGILECKYDDPDWLKDTRAALRSIDPTLIEDDGDVSPVVKPILTALLPMLKYLGGNSYKLDKIEEGFSLLAYRKLISTSIDPALSKYQLSEDESYKVSHLLDAQSYWMDAQYKKIAAHYPEYLEFYIARVMSLANQNLYVMQFDIEHEQGVQRLFKLGMTGRDTDIRLSEIRKQLKAICKVKKASIINVYNNIGRIERALHRGLVSSRYELGSFTEFYSADDVAIEHVLAELKSLGSVEPYTLPIQ